MPRGALESVSQPEANRCQSCHLFANLEFDSTCVAIGYKRFVDSRGDETGTGVISSPFRKCQAVERDA